MPALWATPESREAAAAIVLRPTDVVVITRPKTGTTWLQQICEQLRTRGNMEFTEITERQPWLDLAYDCGVDMDADQHAEPRIFKSHQLLAAVSTGAKYISIVRDPKDVLQSVFSFERAKGIAPFADFDDVNSYAASGHFEICNVWEFYTQLWRAREDPNLLVQSYEELAKDESAYLPRIAEFLGVQLDGSLRQMVLDMSSKDFMLEHADQFDDNYIKSECSNGALHGGNEDASVEKVTTEQRDELTSTTLAWLQAVWDERVLPRTMLKNYQSMSVALAALARGEHP
jgi:aryl sulfotransferase